MIDEKKLIKDIKGWQEDIHDNEYDAKKYDFVFERIYEMAEEQPRVGEWIPCSERLPEAEGEYLCSLYYAIPPYNLFHPENDIYIHTISIQKFDGTSFKSSVIAWMPLPEPYEEGEYENRK